LFAKVFLFLEANRSARDWGAVAIFESRRVEPKYLDPYEDLLLSKRVTRIYLDEFKMPADPPVIERPKPATSGRLKTSHL
jgi:predicted transposase YdaD